MIFMLSSCAGMQVYDETITDLYDMYNRPHPSKVLTVKPEYQGTDLHAPRPFISIENKMYRGRIENSDAWELESESSDKLRRKFIDKYGKCIFLFQQTKDFTIP